MPEYTWCQEKNISAEEWLTGASNECMHESHGIAAAELIKKLYETGKNPDGEQELWFSAGLEGAVAAVFDNTYFVVKKYSSAHQAGFQTLYIGSLDPESGEIVQCMEYSADFAQAAVVREEGLKILFCTETIYQGFPAAQGGILSADSGTLSVIWPCGESGTDWNPESANTDKTIRLEEKSLAIYRIEYIFDAESRMPYDCERVFEERIDACGRKIDFTKGK